MPSNRAEELDELGMIWDTADTAFTENLAAARTCYAQTGTLAAPGHATALDKPVGQWLTNLRRPGGLGKDPERAARRAEQLTAIDPDWNPRALGWTIDWQRNNGDAGTDHVRCGHRRRRLRPSGAAWLGVYRSPARAPSLERMPLLRAASSAAWCSRSASRRVCSQAGHSPKDRVGCRLFRPGSEVPG
ncbi:Helicase associated domain protein [Streptomyces sp. NPDC056352]|uniref:Helicase associated domain protein n=1 Tax=Streptomyces sp. NPDC056352 TaxID=3345791 RepID=UPI0035DC537E